MKSRIVAQSERMKILGFALCWLFLVPSEGWVQSGKPMTITEIVTYSGADREQLLYAGAKTEGKITWYTSLAGDSYKGMVKAFETKYPGVKWELFGGEGSQRATRRVAEET